MAEATLPISFDPGLGTTAGLQDLLAGAAKCYLNPVRFFISWHGVMTLVYSGFPPEMTRLKQRLQAAFPSLPAENPGSKWPKTSLGCVQDGRRLTPQQLDTLNEICLRFSEKLADANSTLVTVDVLSVTIFACRCLERKLADFQVPLSCAQTSASGCSEGVDEAPPEQEEVARVAQVVAATAQPDYWVSASMDGNREKHYRGDHMGVTLVHPLQCTSHRRRQPGIPRVPSAAGLPAIFDEFRAAVDEAVPGMYAWFAPESLHVTLRGVMG